MLKRSSPQELNLLVTSTSDADKTLAAEEEQQAQQNNLLNLVLESLPHPFYIIDAYNHTIKTANGVSSRLCFGLIH